ncbi:Tryptophan aminotransferase-related protein [Quillaja saponaria]|uniref:Tryptophan aminotransferase-related protein n=1 Tax=Quillaja saponaria TaxID=32244 RepID=A0AAD7M4E6_QUISA|nr:Tryptophan aminotransferase-related protein [Quillaja saponaria]
MEKVSSNKSFGMFILAFSIFTFLALILPARGEWEPSWSRRAAEEAEAVAAIPCSGHGRAFLDGLVLDEKQPVCECNSCYGGRHCSEFLGAGCAANAVSGDPIFLEPYWMKHAASSAVLVSGWHRMSYTYSDGSYISQVLEKHIRKLHAHVGNAITDGRYIIFGVGSTQLLNAAVHALSPHTSSEPPAKVIASAPFYASYRTQTEFFNAVDYKFAGDTSLWKNNTSDNTTKFIEFVTSPNNPDGKLNKAILHGPNVKAIYDHAYYWPHFTAIPAPADEDVMLFTISKLTGHAGSRFGWAVIKDEAVYQRMLEYVQVSTKGVPRETQLRALKLLNAVLEEGEAKEIFKFAYKTMRNRWERLNSTLSMSKRFSLQKIAPQFCSFFQKIRVPSPAYAWLKCERQEDKDCYSVLKAANIDGSAGGNFSAEDRYVRLSLIKSQDDFEILLDKFTKLLDEENGARYI